MSDGKPSFTTADSGSVSPTASPSGAKSPDATVPHADPRGDLARLALLVPDESPPPHPTEASRAQEGTSPAGVEGSSNNPISGFSHSGSFLGPLLLALAIFTFFMLVLGVVAYAVLAPPGGPGLTTRLTALFASESDARPPSGSQSAARVLSDRGLAQDSSNPQVTRDDAVLSPKPLVLAEQVLADAEVMRGEVYGQGLLSVNGTESTAHDAFVMLGHGRTTLVVAFFAENISPELERSLANTPSTDLNSFFSAEVPALFVLQAELSPFGSDCAPLSIKRYRWLARVPGSTRILEVPRNPNTTDISEFKEISCVRRKGSIFTLKAEGSTRAVAPDVAGTTARSNAKANRSVIPVSWSVAVRKELAVGTR